MLKTVIAAFLMVCCCFLAAAAADQELEKQLTSQYRDKILYLRHPFTSDSQEYDAQGNPVKAGDEGPWSLYGRMVVNKIDIDKDRLRVEGRRAVYRSDGQGCGKGCMPFKDAGPIKVTIHLNGPLSSSSDADSALNRVFAAAPEDVLRSVPPFWQDYLAKLTNQDPPKGNPIPGGGEVFRVGDNGVTAPRPLSIPEPQFSEAARLQNFQGTLGLNVIIDKTGRVSRVTIGHPLGLGLDEEAVNTVSTWRFAPATRNGEPVAVAMWIEVSFNLGSRR